MGTHASTRWWCIPTKGVELLVRLDAAARSNFRKAEEFRRPDAAHPDLRALNSGLETAARKKLWRDVSSRVAEKEGPSCSLWLDGACSLWLDGAARVKEHATSHFARTALINGRISNLMDDAALVDLRRT